MILLQVSAPLRRSSGEGRGGPRWSPVCSNTNITSVNRRLSKWLIIASDRDRMIGPSSAGRSPHCHHFAGTCQIQSVWIPIGGHYLQQVFYRAFYACLSIAEHILLTLTCLPLRNFLLACGMWGRSVRLLECNGLSFGRRVVSAR